MSRDINRVLLPGEEQTVQAWGDFVYCKVATLPVHVAMDSQIVEMQAGDKLRERERFKAFRIENRSPDTVVYVTLVVGEGDYNSQIIRGEVAVQPKLLTEDGSLREDSRYWLSLFVRHEPGYTPVTYNYMDLVKDWGTLSEPDFSSFNVGMDWDAPNGIWSVRDEDGGKHNEYDSEFQWLREVQGAMAGTGDNQNKFALDEDGEHIFWFADNRIRWGARYTSDADPDEGIAITGTSAPNGNQWRAGLAVHDGYLYAAPDNPIYRATLESARAGNPEWEEIVPNDNYSAEGGIAVGGGLIQKIGAVNDARAYNVTDGSVAHTLDGGVPDSAAAAYKGGLVYLMDEGSVRAYWPKQGPDTLSMQAATAPIACKGAGGLLAKSDYNWQFTLADVTAKSIGPMGELQITGEVIRAALALHTGKADAPAGYLDHVYAVRMNTGTGQAQKAVQANQTFAAAGVADDFRMTLPGEIHIQIDALMFNQ